MGYIKNAFLLFILSNSYAILNSPKKDILKNLIKFKIRKYKNEIQDITDFIDYCLEDPKPIQNDDIDFQYLNETALKNKSTKMFVSLKKINETQLLNDLENIISENKTKNKRKKIK